MMQASPPDPVGRRMCPWGVARFVVSLSGYSLPARSPARVATHPSPRFALYFYLCGRPFRLRCPQFSPGCCTLRPPHETPILQACIHATFVTGTTLQRVQKRGHTHPGPTGHGPSSWRAAPAAALANLKSAGFMGSPNALLGSPGGFPCRIAVWVAPQHGYMPPSPLPHQQRC